MCSLALLFSKYVFSNSSFKKGHQRIVVLFYFTKDIIELSHVIVLIRDIQFYDFESQLKPQYNTAKQQNMLAITVAFSLCSYENSYFFIFVRNFQEISRVSKNFSISFFNFLVLFFRSNNLWNPLHFQLVKTFRPLPTQS